MSEEIINPRIKLTWLRVLVYLILVIATIGIFQVLSVMLLIIFTDLDFAQLANTPKNQLIQVIGLTNFTIINLVSFVGMFFFTWIYRILIDRKPLVTLGLSFSAYKRDFFRGMDWGMFAITTGFLILFVSNFLTFDVVKLDISNIITALILFIFVALNEEIMVRGYILGNLMESYNRYLALTVSSILFMLMHLTNSNLSAIALLNLFLAGILLGVYYIFRKNLWFSIGLHLTWNFFQGPIYGFEVSGTETNSIFNSSVNGNILISGGAFGFEGSLLATVIILLMIFIIHQKYRTEINTEKN